MVVKLIHARSPSILWYSSFNVCNASVGLPYAGKWLHAALHLAEGDLSENAKLWYQQVDPPLLSKFYDSPPVASAEAFVSRVIEAHQALKSAGGSLESMDPETTSKNEQVRKQKWDELVTIMRELEAMHGWKEVDGSQFYTKDEDPSHKSNVLGKQDTAQGFNSCG